MKQALKLTFVAILIMTSIPAASAAFNGTLFVGTPVELDAMDLAVICRDIARDGNSAWIELENRADVPYGHALRLYSHILKQGDVIIYDSDSGLLAYRLDAIFHGTQTNMVKISPIDPSGIDTSTLRTRPDSILISVGERRNLIDGAEIMYMMGINGDKVWIVLKGDGMGQYSHIMTEDDPIVYRNNSNEWVAYRIDAIFRGIEQDMIELSPIDPPIDPSAIDFNYVEGLWDNFVLDLGSEKDLGGGITLRCTGVDMLDGTAWIELSRDGEVLYNHILREGEYVTYEYSGMLHCYEVHRVFTGERRRMNTPAISKDGERMNTRFTVEEVKFVEFSPVKISDIDMASVPDRSGYIMVGLGVPVELSGGAELLLNQIDLSGEAVLIEIKRNEHEKSGKVINRTHPSFAYRVGDTEYAYDLEAVFLGTDKSAIEISFVGSSPVVGGDPDIQTHTPAPAVPAFTAFAAIVVLGLLAVVRWRRRRHS